MLQLMPGLLYVIVITVVFTAVLIGGTAASLLTQARAINRKRYIGPVFSESNTKKVSKLRPVLVTAAGVLISVKDETTNRLLTTFKRPAELRLYDDFFFARPFFSSSAYLVPLRDVLETSLMDNTLVIRFKHNDREITLRCKSYNRTKWINTLNKLVSNHK